ncbi:MAG: hypothetical protein FOGNACKC_00931 [Anaerolineae bacterium]|nr:hypothetical protein [Anaerolineae bacterium]
MRLDDRSYWRFASTLDRLDRGYLMLYGLPDPALFNYQSYAEEVQDSSGNVKRYGNATYILRWRQMDAAQTYQLKSLIEPIIAAKGWLYMTADRADASAPGRDWVDLRGKPRLTEIAAVANSRGRVFEEVSLQLSMVEIINTPSNVFEPVLTYSLDFSKSHNSGYLPFL